MFAAPARASAEAKTSERVALTWTAPAGCPSADRVVAEVDRLLGGAPATTKPALAVTATVAVDPSGELRVHIEAPPDPARIPAEREPRVRELHAASCEALADATATILALMIDPDSVIAAPPPAAPVAPVAPVAPPETPPPSRFAPRVRLGAWALVDGGTLPGVGLGAAGSAAMTLGALELELGFTGLPSRSARLPERPTAGGDVSLLAGTAAACYDVLPFAFSELAPCLGWEAGDMRASGFGVSAPGAGESLWSAARAGARFAWSPIRRLAIVLRGDAIVPVTRPNFFLQNVGTVFRPGAAAARASLGLEVRL